MYSERVAAANSFIAQAACSVHAPLWYPYHGINFRHARYIYNRPMAHLQVVLMSSSPFPAAPPQLVLVTDCRRKKKKKKKDFTRLVQQ